MCLVESFGGSSCLTKTNNGKCEMSFIASLMYSAYFDSPREIEEWCKTPMCRFMAQLLDIDINLYKAFMMKKAQIRLKEEINRTIRIKNQRVQKKKSRKQKISL